MKLEELVGKPITEEQFDEAAGKKDACYRKVKARYDVWPSAYASGALVKCRKVGAANWGNKSKKEGLDEANLKKLEKIGGELHTLIAMTDVPDYRNIVDDFLTTSATFEMFPEKQYLDKAKKLLPKVISFIQKQSVKLIKNGEKKPQDVLKSIKDIKKKFNELEKEGLKEGLGDKIAKRLKKHKGVNLKKKKVKRLKLKGRGVYQDYDGMEGFASNAQRRAAFASGYKAKGKKKKKEGIEEARGTCWVGYQQLGMKKKGGKMVPNCVKEITEIFYEEDGKGYGYTFEYINDGKLNEAEYQGRKVKLGKIMQGDAKKFKVYVKNPKGNVVKVNFGQGGKAKGGTMKIRKSNRKASKSFRARHNWDNPGPRHKARYWSCRKW